MKIARLSLLAATTLLSASLATRLSAAHDAAPAPALAQPVMEDPNQARVDYIENCGGCHGVNGSTVPAQLPELLGRVGWFMCTPDSRAYLLRLPNVAHSRIRDNAELAEQMAFLQNSVGGVQGPFDSFLALRGLKTLPLRMKAHCANALELAQWLEAHPAIEKVIYPGLPSHPQHELATRQMSGYGGIVSIVLKGGFEAAKRFCERTELFTLAESLGGVESLVNHPAVMTHASIPPARREQLGISDALVRLSVGVEDSWDLRADLQRALS